MARVTRDKRKGRRKPSLLEVPAVDASPLWRSLRGHLEALEVRQLAHGTLRERARCLRDFALWAQERALQRPEDFTRAILERYQRHLFHYRKVDGTPLSAVTQAGVVAGLRSYFRWAVRDGQLAANPAADLERPRTAKTLPRRVLSALEVERVLSVPDVATAEGLRDRAVLEVLYSTGIRRTEACRLGLHSVHVGRGTLFVEEGKGRKDRVVPIGERALAWVGRYLEEARPKLWAPPERGVLFLAGHGGPLEPEWLSTRVGGYVRQSGVAAQGGCHLLRHAAATLMLEGGADVRFVQEMLGHASLETTQVYTRVSITKLKAVHDACHPAARLERRRDAGEGASEEVATVEVVRQEVLAQLAREAEADE